MKIRSHSILAALAISASPAVIAGDVVTLTWKKDAPENSRTAVLTLAAGESAEYRWGGTSTALDNADFSASSPVLIRTLLSIGGATRSVPLLAPLQSGSSIGGVSAWLPLKVSGPAQIAISITATWPENLAFAIATFDVIRVGTASPPAEVPQEAGSNFDVVLEQSSDLVNWTPANPGTYSGTETKRFFRTRIVKKQ
jgi:hypothetical protein